MHTLDLPMADKGQIIALLGQLVLAEARTQVEIQDAARNPYTDLGRLIDKVADPGDLPHLFAAFAEGSTEEGAGTSGIELILDGVAARVRQVRQRRNQGA